MYQWSSSVNYMKDIRSPIIFINAKDDPLVPEAMLAPVRNFASKCASVFFSATNLISVKISAQKKQVLHLELAHGGHLGFYEGGLLYPNPVTWLDRALVALTAGIIQTSLKTKSST
jgi:abhydrolase domain-containing protein 2